MTAPNSVPFYIQKGSIYAIPILHYNMEMACQVKLAFDTFQPDCVAVELPETMHEQLIHAASRLPDISVLITYASDHSPLFLMCEPCDPLFEGLRSALEIGAATYCIDLDVDRYPEYRDDIPDPYAIQRIGLESYYKLYRKHAMPHLVRTSLDIDRETYMARRLKELSLSHERILFISGMNHVESVLNLIDSTYFPEYQHIDREAIQLCTLTAESCRDVLAENGWITMQYEKQRDAILHHGPLDRQKSIFHLYKESAELYKVSTGNSFPGYNLRNTMKFLRNYSLVRDHLMPDLFQILTAAKGCVDHNYAQEVWNLATSYDYRRNIDGLVELDLSIEDVWGHSKIIRFHTVEKGRKGLSFKQNRKDKSTFKFKPPGPFSICSYPPEDLVIERFGQFLQKKGSQILTDESSRTIPFSTSLEDGIDTRETIRHWSEKKLYVKTAGKPPTGIGSVCIIFDEDKPEEGKIYHEKYPWVTTWIGEHQQESDMALFATPLAADVVGPGISRCEYGGFMMSYPPRRLDNIWADSDYHECRSKAEVLLMAAIDYAIHPVIVYVAKNPPRSIFKSFAGRYGKKIVYIPIGQLSSVTLNKLRIFHVLDGHDRRDGADEYIRK